jgi:hypothetical protein
MALNGTWMATIIAAIPCVMLDIALRRVQMWQERRGGAISRPSGPLPGLAIAISANFLLCAGFCFLYADLWKGSGHSFIYGGTVWLLFVIPAVLLLHSMDELKQRIMTTRILGWLFKAGAASISLAYFVG